MSDTTGTGDTTGQTKDAGWELGVRETVAAPVDAVWTYLTGEGLKVWLGDIDALPTEKKAAYSSRDGVRGTIRGYTPNARVRLSWQPEDWPHDTTLQFTVKEVATGTTIGIHHEQLADREERKLMLGHWKNVMAAMVDDLREW
jgi:uncharacterized protein YndB with AHSA1/START domain